MDSELDEIIRPEHVETACKLYDIVKSKYASVVHESFLGVWSSFIVEQLYKHRQNLFKEQDMAILEEEAASFVGPHGPISALIFFLMHWCPKPKDADLDDIQHRDESEWEDLETWVDIETLQPSNPMKRKATVPLTPPSNKKGLGKDQGLHDLIKKKYNILDSNGQRLNGTKPYDWDPSVSDQIALSFQLLEMSEAEWVLLMGLKNRVEFTEMYGKFTDGQSVKVGHKFRKVYAIRHTEHTGKYATVKQLEELLATLKQMKADGFPSSIGFDFMADLISKRRKKKTIATQPQKPVVRFAKVKKDMRRLMSVSKQQREKAPWNRSVHMKTMYENTPGLAKHKGSQMLEYLQSHPEVEEERVQKMVKSRKEDKSGAVAAGIIRRAVGDAVKKFEKEVRWKPTQAGDIFDIGAWCTKSNQAIAPHAVDLPFDQILLNLPDALAFVGADVPECLPKSTLSYRRCHWMSDDELPNESARQILFAREWPVAIGKEKTLWYPSFQSDKVFRILYLWQRLMVFAEDVIELAKRLGIRGMECVGYASQTGKWIKRP